MRFAAIKSAYRSLVKLTGAIADTDRPRVMTGVARRGSFFIAGGRSYVATLIKDAGGRYVWADNPATATAVVDLEAQVQRAASADIWINGGEWKNLASMIADEPRYAEFKACAGTGLGVERLVNATGGNDYWSRRSPRPDLLLADLIKILHRIFSRSTASSGTSGFRPGRPMAIATSVNAARPLAEKVDVEWFARHRSREMVVLAGLATLLPTVFFLSLIVGSTWIPPAHVWAIVRGASGVHDAEAIVVDAIRLPRSITAVLAGASLGVAGLQMQTLFRNPLADPFALGVSAGASLGVALLVLGSGLGATVMFSATLGPAAHVALTPAATVVATPGLGLLLLVSPRVASPTTVLIPALRFGYAVSSVCAVSLIPTSP